MLRFHEMLLDRTLFLPPEMCNRRFFAGILVELAEFGNLKAIATAADPIHRIFNQF